MEKKKNVLIIGNSISAIATAQKLRAQECVENIFVVGLPVCEEHGFKFIDIREDKAEELLSFALENSIDLTIVVSKKALKADVAGVFSANGQMVFAPDYDSSKHFIDSAMTKKFLYKLKIPTSKFGVFEKQQLALDYLKTASFPLVIKASEASSERDLFACPTISVANIAINDLFFKAENKVVIEEFVNGHNFNFYVVTDGYMALPLGIVTSYKFSDEVNGGYLTLGSGAIAPDFKISSELQDKLMKDVVNRVLTSLESCGTPYVGILGFNCVLKDEKIYVQAIEPFFSDVDAPVVFNTLNENLFELFNACAMGVFADDYEDIKVNDLSALAVSIFSRYENKEICGVESLDNPENLFLFSDIKGDKKYTKKGCIGVICANASTLGRAKSNLRDEIELIKFDGKKYRLDILN